MDAMVSHTPDGVICDLDGVVYRGALPVEGVVEALSRLRERGAKVLYCTNNSSRSRADYLRKLRSLGLHLNDEDLLTSATVLGEVLRGRSGRAFCIGGEGLREEVVAAGIEPAEDHHVEMVCVGFDPGFDYRAMRTATTAVLQGADLLATNDDASFPAEEGLWPGAGAILASIETATGRRAEVVGKPHDGMIRAARRRLVGCEDVVVVGDRIETDIEMARRAGWRSCLVLSGVTPPAELDDGVADEVYASLAHAPWAQ